MTNNHKKLEKAFWLIFGIFWIFMCIIVTVNDGKSPKEVFKKIMAREEIIRCDICGEVMPHETHNGITLRDADGDETYYEDICDECYDKIESTISNMLGKNTKCKGE